MVGSGLVPQCCCALYLPTKCLGWGHWQAAMVCVTVGEQREQLPWCAQRHQSPPWFHTQTHMTTSAEYKDKCPTLSYNRRKGHFVNRYPQSKKLPDKSSHFRYFLKIASNLQRNFSKAAFNVCFLKSKPIPIPGSYEQRSASAHHPLLLLSFTKMLEVFHKYTLMVSDLLRPAH